MVIRMKGFRRDSGFSLIEVLVAVVILATGLLALTALQGRLAQASADAKVRSRVASLLSSRMDELRAAQYASIPPAAGTASSTVTATCAGGATWVCSAETESRASALSVGHTYARFMDVSGTFTNTGATAPNLSTAEFKRITLTATWTDAAGSNRSLAVSTDVSPLSLTANRIPNAPGGAGSGGKAIVRQDNPAGPGVIPIAIGGGDATAASNPRPEVIGKNNNASVVGTRFDVLTYEGLSGASVIQRRVETAAISCTCQYGAGGTNLGAIYQTAQWPAEWTGERYEVIAPTGATVAPGDALISKSGPASGVDQSPLCTECCRDHHDAAGNATKFDPVRTGTYEHYNDALTAVGTSNGTQYIEACRLVRVDGFWRTATDMYAKHFGLINTTAVGGVEAKTGAPDATAVTNYQASVKTYLAAYTGGAATVADASDGGQVTGTININAPPTIDERYLHARGLYVDYLSQKARDRIAKARLPANCPGGDYTECTLPFLPFTTINATELAYWEPQISGTQNGTILSVATGSSLVFSPLQPTRGRTNARAGAANGAVSDSAALITRSNAGVAIADAVDPADNTAIGTDKQPFRIVASGSTTPGQTFTVRAIGLSQTSDTNKSNDPAIAWTNATGNANCNASFANNGDKNPNDYACDTFGTLGIATTVRIASYFREYTVSQSMTATCGTQPVTATVDRPTFANNVVSAAAIGTTQALSLTPALDGKTTEYTDIAFASVPNASRVDVSFGTATILEASIASCVATRKNANSAWEFSNIVWTKSWTP